MALPAPDRFFSLDRSGPSRLGRSFVCCRSARTAGYVDWRNEKPRLVPAIQPPNGALFSGMNFFVTSNDVTRFLRFITSFDVTAIWRLVGAGIAEKPAKGCKLLTCKALEFIYQRRKAAKLLTCKGLAGKDVLRVKHEFSARPAGTNPPKPSPHYIELFGRARAAPGRSAAGRGRLGALEGCRESRPGPLRGTLRAALIAEKRDECGPRRETKLKGPVEFRILGQVAEPTARRQEA